jgi:hypothetical protein
MYFWDVSWTPCKNLQRYVLLATGSVIKLTRKSEFVELYSPFHQTYWMVDTAKRLQCLYIRKFITFFFRFHCPFHATKLNKSHNFIAWYLTHFRKEGHLFCCNIFCKYEKEINVTFLTQHTHTHTKVREWWLVKLLRSYSIAGCCESVQFIFKYFTEHITLLSPTTKVKKLIERVLKALFKHLCSWRFSVQDKFAIN